MGMTVKESIQKLSRKGIWIAVATLRRAFAVTAVCSRILLTMSRDLGTITDKWTVLHGNWDVVHCPFRERHSAVIRRSDLDISGAVQTPG
jgi:hypothetical protein